jgi:hypothetical protein
MENLTPSLVEMPAPPAPKQRKGLDPLAMGQVDRAVKAALPTGLHISKDARVAMHKAATMFLLLISTLVEDEKSRQPKRKATLSGVDIQRALNAAGFDRLASDLTLKRGR